MTVAKLEEKNYKNGMFNIYYTLSNVGTVSVGTEEVIPVPKEFGVLNTIHASAYFGTLTCRINDRPSCADNDIHEIFRISNQPVTFSSTGLTVLYNSLTPNLYATFTNTDKAKQTGTITVQLIGT